MIILNTLCLFEERSEVSSAEFEGKVELNVCGLETKAGSWRNVLIVYRYLNVFRIKN